MRTWIIPTNDITLYLKRISITFWPFLHGVTSNGDGGGCLLEGEVIRDDPGGEVDNCTPYNWEGILNCKCTQITICWIRRFDLWEESITNDKFLKKR